jgi:hypothetical protein
MACFANASMAIVWLHRELLFAEFRQKRVDYNLDMSYSFTLKDILVEVVYIYVEYRALRWA